MYILALLSDGSLAFQFPQVSPPGQPTETKETRKLGNSQNDALQKPKKPTETYILNIIFT